MLASRVALLVEDRDDDLDHDRLEVLVGRRWARLR